MVPELQKAKTGIGLYWPNGTLWIVHTIKKLTMAIINTRTATECVCYIVTLKLTRIYTKCSINDVYNRTTASMLICETGSSIDHTTQYRYIPQP